MQVHIQPGGMQEYIQPDDMDWLTRLQDLGVPAVEAGVGGRNQHVQALIHITPLAPHLHRWGGGGGAKKRMFNLTSIATAPLVFDPLPVSHVQQQR